MVLREFSTSTGYTLLVDDVLVDIVETKADEKGENIASSLSIQLESLALRLFHRKGGLGRFYESLGSRMKRF